MVIIILVISVIVGALANVLIKAGTMRLPPISADNFFKIAASPLVILGALLFVLNFPLYGYLLQKMKIGIAFPLMTSLTIVAVIIISVFYFKEGLSLIQYVGLSLLVVSLWMLSK